MMYANTVKIASVVIDQAKTERWVQEQVRSAMESAIDRAATDAVEKAVGNLIRKKVADRIQALTTDAYMEDWLNKIVGEAWGDRSDRTKRELTAQLKRADRFYQGENDL